MSENKYKWSAAVERAYLIEGGTKSQRVNAVYSICRFDAHQYEVVVKGLDAKSQGLIRFQFYEFAEEFMKQASAKHANNYMPLIRAFINAQKPEVVFLPTVEADYGLTPEIYEGYPLIAKIVIGSLD